jgi:predicted pyridoxine 5'-phosphate oxidase superfamily flavin-nucleotide-binding protein
MDRTEIITPSTGQQLARARWGTQASGEAFDRKKFSYLTEQARTFIVQQRFCVIAGVDTHYELCGLIAPGVPGFVQAWDEQTCVLSLPASLQTTRLMQSILQSRSIGRSVRLGLFFISHPTRERLCVHGIVTAVADSASNSFDYTREDRTIHILVHAHQSFFHCAKYIKTRVPGLTSPAEIRAKRGWRVDQILYHPRSYLTGALHAFLTDHLLCYLCTVDRHGQPAVNHRGGAAGFLIGILPDAAFPGGRILLPDYSGNGAFEAIGNIFETGKAMLIVPDYAAQLAVSFAGSAQVLDRDELPGELAEKCTGAERIIALTVERIETQMGDWSAALAAERNYAAEFGIAEDTIFSCSI